MHRSAYLAWKMLGALIQNDSFRVIARDAYIVFFAFLLEIPRDFSRRDYFNPKNSEYRIELAKRVRECAFKAGIEMELPQLGKIIGKLSAIIGGETATGNDDITLGASCIMAADLLDRSCATRGFFEPELAYDFIRRIKRGTYSTIHPSILSCMLKILAEAVVATSFQLTLAKKKRKDPSLRERARLHKEQRIGTDEARVEITSLAPGMRLSRPIESYDGKVVLPEDLVLDQDLIWRIWQLSAIKPLNAPLIVSADKKEE